LQGSGRDTPESPHGADTIADPDLDVSWLELGDGCAVSLEGDEIDGRARRRGAALLAAIAAMVKRMSATLR
jgi:hypothetical protein